jgi:DNA-binding response OmpR family regulator
MTLENDPAKVARPTVLVADDDAAFCDTTCDLLREAGYEVDGVSDAQTAHSRIAEKDYDLLITDIRMPGSRNLDYLEPSAAQAIRIPVMVITGYPSVETASKALRLPVVSYLVKPLDIEPFLAEVRRAVGLRQVQNVVQRAVEQSQSLVHHLGAAKALLATNPREATSAPTAQHLLHLLLNDVHSTMATLEQYFVASMQAGTIAPDESATFRPLALVDVLQEAVIALGKSRDTFKSKELGDLRQKIEKLLNVAKAKSNGTSARD